MQERVSNVGKFFAPYRAPQEIENKACEVLEHFDETILNSAVQTPLMEFMEFMRTKYNVIYDFQSDLGMTQWGTKILGIFDRRKRGILIDRSLWGTAYFSFTLAHEIGHLVLHRRLNIPAKEYSFTPDTARDLVTGRKKIQNTKERVEWQANRFASAFIMPQTTFRQALVDTQKDMGIVRNIGVVYVGNDASSLKDFDDLLSRLAGIFGSSRAVVRNRLSDLSLLTDHRAGEAAHISQLLSED